MQDHVSAYMHRSGEQQAAPSSCDLAAVDDVPANGHKPGKAVTASVYRAKIAGHSRVVTVSWSRDLLSHAFAVAISGADGAAAECRIELRPWQFWRRAGSRRVELGGGASTAPATVRVLWDLRRARFGAGIPEPRGGYYVALEAAGEVVLVQGDMRRDALRRAACAPAEAEAVPVAPERAEQPQAVRRAAPARPEHRQAQQPPPPRPERRPLHRGRLPRRHCALAAGKLRGQPGRKNVACCCVALAQVILAGFESWRDAEMAK